jgi:aspartate/methionine/tyrosine aminotransferase
MNLMKVSPSASMEITRLAAQMRKSGEEVFTLSIGDTHFSPPTAIRRRLEDLPLEYSHYTDGSGLIELREIIAGIYNGYDSSDVVIVPGLKQGLYCLMCVLPITNVLLLEPAWLGYHSITSLAGKQFTSLNLYDPDWISKLNQTSFEAIVLCHPNNPNGKLFSEKELLEILQIVQKNNAWLITDEIYDAYQYNNSGEISNIFEGYSRLIRCNGMSKSHAMTGFRIGYMLVKDKSLRNLMSIFNQNTITCTPAISQYLSLGYRESFPEISKFRDYYFENRSLVLEFFPEWSSYLPDGGFYFFVNLADYGIFDGDAFCRDCLKDAHVALVPGSAYGTGFDSWIRLSFSLDRTELRKALLALQNYLNENGR